MNKYEHRQLNGVDDLFKQFKSPIIASVIAMIVFIFILDNQYSIVKPLEAQNLDQGPKLLRVSYVIVEPEIMIDNGMKVNDSQGMLNSGVKIVVYRISPEESTCVGYFATNKDFAIASLRYSAATVTGSYLKYTPQTKSQLVSDILYLVFNSSLRGHHAP